MERIFLQLILMEFKKKTIFYFKFISLFNFDCECQFGSIYLRLPVFDDLSDKSTIKVMALGFARWRISCVSKNVYIEKSAFAKSPVR